MKCALCRHGSTLPGKTTVTLEREGTIVVIRDCPADVCQQCGEYYLNEITTEKIFAVAQDAANRHAEVEMVRYATLLSQPPPSTVSNDKSWINAHGQARL
ncbi:MAG: uncharacterized protein HW380_1349 [Magnetococcales bacterium]|nr:uncharacterized protein [Magnetococcales bacterium]HIJ85940.1 type II toxin-antitoxin system MqsA family antitoxin [Magnetococcales bacterium]